MCGILTPEEMSSYLYKRSDKSLEWKKDWANDKVLKERVIVR
jgi:hypothetical protein